MLKKSRFILFLVADPQSALVFNSLNKKLRGKAERRWGILYFLLQLTDQPKPTNVNLSKLSSIDVVRKLRKMEETAKETPKEQIVETEKNYFDKFLEIRDKQRGKTEIEAIKDCLLFAQTCNSDIVDVTLSGQPGPQLEIQQSFIDIGKAFKKIEDMTKSDYKRPKCLIRQGFMTFAERSVLEFYQFIAAMEQNVIQGQASIVKGITLRKLYSWISEYREKFNILLVVMAETKILSGSKMIDYILEKGITGDKLKKKLFDGLLQETLSIYFKIIQTWIHTGKIVDPFDEFFIVQSLDAEDSSNIWDSKFELIENMIPKCIGVELAKKILSAGKTVHFLSSVSNQDLEKWESTYSFKDGKNIKFALFRLEEHIDSVLQLSSKKLKDQLMNSYHLKETFLCLKWFLMLGKGDFVQKLIGNLEESLQRPADEMYHHNIIGLLDSALKASSDGLISQELLQRIDVRILHATSNEIGWDVFSLDMHVVHPINLLITEECMKKYLRIFHILWKFKYVEETLNHLWNDLHGILRQVKLDDSTFY